VINTLAHAMASDVEILKFPLEKYSVHTIKISLPSSITTVTFKRYHHITYASKPVDPNYQSMDILIPIEINGTLVDPTNAPILLVINVGGYMSYPNTLGGSNGVPLNDVVVRTNAAGYATNVDGVIRAALGLASGFVVIIPGVRGWDNRFPNGVYYGKAPAAIVDLKAAVRYIRYNADVFPGNENWIIATGCSAGGALAALLAASADNPFYEPYLEAIGAAKASDRIFAAAPYNPIMDFEHASTYYEWQFKGRILVSGEHVDSKCSEELSSLFFNYLEKLGLYSDEDELLTIAEYPLYVVDRYLRPAATKYILSLPQQMRENYLRSNPWIKWVNNTAFFTWGDYVSYGVQRFRGCPAYDSPDLSRPYPENLLFGNETVNARHITDYSLRVATGDPEASVDPRLKTLIAMMNPMHFISRRWKNIANYWFIRTGSKDIFASIFMWTNLAIALENLGKSVDFEVYWEAPHCTDYEPWKLMEWVQNITGYRTHFLKQLPTQITTYTMTITYRDTYTTYLTQYTTTVFLEVERTETTVQTIYRVEPTTIVVEKTVTQNTKSLVIAIALPLTILVAIAIIVHIKKGDNF